jgi:hypothetical protein
LSVDLDICYSFAACLPALFMLNLFKFSCFAIRENYVSILDDKIGSAFMAHYSACGPVFDYSNVNSTIKSNWSVLKLIGFVRKLQYLAISCCFLSGKFSEFSEAFFKKYIKKPNQIPKLSLYISL